MRTVSHIVRLGVAVSAIATGALLAPTAAAESTFDVTVLAATCANCHGPDGRSPASIPTIAGRPESILLEQLRAFQSDTPPAGTTIMGRLTQGLTDDELVALARHFSQINAQP
ncbi:MAG TPA: hypothetical protein VKZ71_05030 [Burkholderiaceae bacterium]|nr:hypothetical protein [Burkholderiaceae bacterium]